MNAATPDIEFLEVEGATRPAALPSVFPPFRRVQPQHLWHQVELTQDQRLIRAKQIAGANAATVLRDAATENLLTRRAAVARERVYTGEPITELGGL